MKPQRLIRRARSAFTLLEVTLATAIFATSVVVLTSAFSNALTALQTRRTDANHEPMLRFLRSKIITIPDRDQFEQGEELYLPDGDSANWNATVLETPLADLFKVHLRMEIHSGAPERATEHEEDLYLLRPSWSESDDRSNIIEEAERELNTQRRTYTP